MRETMCIIIIHVISFQMVEGIVTQKAGFVVMAAISSSSLRITVVLCR